MRVLKFGGTSVADASALRQVLPIIQQQSAIHKKLVVVLSATSGTTDSLLRVARAAGDRDEETVQGMLEELARRHYWVVDDLIDSGEERLAIRATIDSLIQSLTEYCHGLSLLGECTKQSLDEVASYGERLSTTIVASACRAAGINAQWLDARTVVATDDNYQHGTVNMARTADNCLAHLLPLLSEFDVVITQGFIASAPDGTTTTLGRGGSDYSAAILGAACNASAIDIYTDVSGVLTADPRIVEVAQPIPVLGFFMMREMALYGAKVLHPDTIAPAVEAEIPVRVLNTFEANNTGTTITASGGGSNVTAITGLPLCMRVEAPLIQLADVLRRHRFEVVYQEASLTGTSCVVRLASTIQEGDVHAALAGIDATAFLCGFIVVCSEQTLSQPSLSKAVSALDGTSGVRISTFSHGRSLAFCVLPNDYRTSVSLLHSALVGSALR